MKKIRLLLAAATIAALSSCADMPVMGTISTDDASVSVGADGSLTVTVYPRSNK